MLIYEKIFDVLKNKNIDVYAPNTHIGECTTSYVVLKEGTSSKYRAYSSTITYFDILCYAKNYTECLMLKQKVKNAMTELMFSVMPTYNETEVFYDEIAKAYMTSVEYRNYKQIE